MHEEVDQLRLDRRLVNEGPAAYEELLCEDARIIVPGAVLDRTGCIAAIRGSAPWRDAELTLLWYRESIDGYTVVYRFRGRRDESHSAVMSSSWIRTDRGDRLLVHQQTPIPEGRTVADDR